MATRKPRMRSVRMRPVSIDVDETATHWLVFVSPHLEAQKLGIGYHRSRLPKCLCKRFSGKGKTCRWCYGWSAAGMASYVGRLLRSYPRISVRVPAEQVETRRAAGFTRMAA